MKTGTKPVFQSILDPRLVPLNIVTGTVNHSIRHGIFWRDLQFVLYAFLPFDLLRNLFGQSFLSGIGDRSFQCYDVICDVNIDCRIAKVGGGRKRGFGLKPDPTVVGALGLLRLNGEAVGDATRTAFEFRTVTLTFVFFAVSQPVKLTKAIATKVNNIKDFICFSCLPLDY